MLPDVPAGDGGLRSQHGKQRRRALQSRNRPANGLPPVVSGRLGLRVNGVEHVLEPGDVVVAQAGAPHAAWNAGSEEVHALVDFRPALRTETAFETLAGLAQDGMTASAGAPKNPFRLALVLRHFEDEIYLARPPLAVQRVLLGAVAAVGRLLGYRPEYPYPGHLQPTNQPVGSNQ